MWYLMILVNRCRQSLNAWLRRWWYMFGNQYSLWRQHTTHVTYQSVMDILCMKISFHTGKPSSLFWYCYCWSPILGTSEGRWSSHPPHRLRAAMFLILQWHFLLLKQHSKSSIFIFVFLVDMCILLFNKLTPTL